MPISISNEEIKETIHMIQAENLDIRTITMGISLRDCADSDVKKTADKVYEKIVRYAHDLAHTGEVLAEEYGVPIINKRVSVTPISLIAESCQTDSYVPIACYSGNSSDKINHARTRSRQCTIDTVEDLMDINIDFYFESNFAGLVDMVDAVGGIIIDNPYKFVGQESDNRGKYTIWVPAGVNRRNGEPALA